MSNEIYLSIADPEHATKQPLGRRYAVFCSATYKNPDCPTTSRGGHIGDFVDYRGAKEVGVTHPHPVKIRFFEDLTHAQPSPDFMQDLNAQAKRIGSVLNP